VEVTVKEVKPRQIDSLL